MDGVRGLEIIEKLNDKSRLSDNGECVVRTGCCKGRRVRYGVMCINVSLHGSVWKCESVHRLALLKGITAEGTYKPKSAGCFKFTRGCQPSVS